MGSVRLVYENSREPSLLPLDEVISVTHVEVETQSSYTSRLLDYDRGYSQLTLTISIGYIVLGKRELVSLKNLNFLFMFLILFSLIK